MNFNIQNNQGVPTNPQYQLPMQQSFVVGNSNIAPNIIQQPNPYMMMSGMGPGFTSPYPFPPPVMDHQPTPGSQTDKTVENNTTAAGLQPQLPSQLPCGFTNQQNPSPLNQNQVSGPFGFHSPMMAQPSIITAAPTVIPQPQMPNMIPTPPLINPQMMNTPILNPQMMNVNNMMNKTKVAPQMTYPMKPLIDTLLNPVVVNVPEKDDTPTLTNVVYVGGLTTDTSNEFVINMLQKCGKTVHFKRHTDPSSGLLATFAFCDFESPGGAYYAIECLTDLNYGDNKLKVSCNSKVRCQIDDWKVGKIEELCHKFPDKTKEEVVKEFENYKQKLKNEFIELIEIRFKTLVNQQSETKGNEDNNTDSKENNKVNIDDDTPRSSSKEFRDNKDRDEYDNKNTKERQNKEKEKEKERENMGLTKDYVVHRKEAERMFKLKEKKKKYDNKYREQLIEWERDENKMFKKLRALFEVQPSKRDKLIQEDISGKSKPNLKHRDKEIEEDKKDEQEEYEENKSKKISLKLYTNKDNRTKEEYDNRDNKEYNKVDKDNNNKQHDNKDYNNEYNRHEYDNRDNRMRDEENKEYKRQKINEDGSRSNMVETNRDKVVTLFSSEVEEVKKTILSEEEIWKMVPINNIFEQEIEWDLLFSSNLSILIEPWIRRCILEYMGDEESLVNEVLEFIFNRLKERPKPQELLFDVEQFLDEESHGFVNQLWKLLVFHQIRLKNL